MKKRILYISDVVDLKGGAENSLFDLLCNKNIEPFLAVPSKGQIYDKAKSLGYPCFIVNFGNVSSIKRVNFGIKDFINTFNSAIKTANQIKKICKSEKIDIVHTNGLKAHAVACLARIMFGKNVVCHYRSIPYNTKEKAFWQFTRIIAKRLVFVSRPCWHGKKLPNNGKVIFNGFNFDNLTLEEKKLSSKVTIGFIGRIQFTKGLETLVEWIDYALKQESNIKLVIRGEASPDEKDYENKIKQMIKERNIEKYCDFQGKIIGIDKVYKDIDINVVSSVVPDPLPRSVMESMSIGIPVIGYPAGGIPYMLDDQNTGFLVKTKEEFLSAIQQLINDNKRYNEIRRNAFKSAKEKFAIEKLHKSITEVYNS